MSQMPFADNGSVTISVTCQHIGQSFFIFIQSVFTPRRNNGCTYAKSIGITPCHKSGTSGRTDRSCIEPIQYNSFCCQSVQTRSFYLAAMKSDISPSQIVSKYNNDIRAFYLLCKRQCSCTYYHRRPQDQFIHYLSFFYFFGCFGKTKFACAQRSHSVTNLVNTSGCCSATLKRSVRSFTTSYSSHSLPFSSRIAFQSLQRIALLF